MDFSHDQRFNAQKAGGIGVVALAHVILGGALVYCLHSMTVPVEHGPTTFTPLPPPEVMKPVDPPPTSDVHPKHVDIYVPAPEVPTTPVHDNVIKDVTTIAPESPVWTKTLAVNDGNGNVNVKPVIHSSSSVISNLDACKPSYPRDAIMREEEGTVRLKMDIGANGQLLGASVVKSSGYSDLDRAAVKGLSQCAFRPAMQDGTPVQSSLVTDYVWALER